MLSNCSTVKEAFDPQRKNSSDEFLVEKKSPLSMPPEFNEITSSIKVEIEEDKDQNKDIELLISKNNKGQNIQDQINKSDKDFLKVTT